VSLKDRMLAKPGASAVAAHRQRSGLDQYPGGLGPLGACDRYRTRTELSVQVAFDLPGAVTETSRQPADAFALDHPVGDQPHRASRHVGTLIPLR